MARMALSQHFPMFHVEWVGDDGARRSETVAMVLCTRANKFPGLLRRVRLGGALARNDYRLMIFRTNKVRHFLNFFASVVSGWNWKVPQVELACSTWFRCTPLQSAAEVAIHSEADAELLGTLPLEVAIEARTFRLPIPESP